MKSMHFSGPSTTSTSDFVYRDSTPNWSQLRAVWRRRLSLLSSCGETVRRMPLRRRCASSSWFSSESPQSESPVLCCGL